jgi:hypothetical protein
MAGCHGRREQPAPAVKSWPQLAEEVAHGTGARSAAILDGEIWNECQSLQPSVGWGELMEIGKRAYDENRRLAQGVCASKRSSVSRGMPFIWWYFSM